MFKKQPNLAYDGTNSEVDIQYVGGYENESVDMQVEEQARIKIIQI
jgi:hypothetical protein